MAVPLPTPASAPAFAAAPLLERGLAGPLSRAAERTLRLFGWRVALARLVPAKSVVVFYPHTSNWDFVVGLLAKWATGVEFRWVGKHTLFATPLARLFVRWGGIPVDRRDPAGFVETLGRAYRAAATFHLVITPEGTRGRTEHWKSGFHRLALAVDAPVGLAFIDRGRRHIGIGAWVRMSGDVERDLDLLRAFYADKRGWRPVHAGPIRFRDQRRSAPR